MALDAAEELDGEVGVYNFRFVKPFDLEMLDALCQKYEYLVTIEDGCLKGGLFSEVSEYVARLAKGPVVEGVGVPDEFIKHARQSEQREYCGLSAENLRKICKKYLENKK